MPKQNRPPMPIEKLLADKNEVETKCGIQEKRLYDDLEYIRSNAANLLLSGLTTLLFSSGNAKNAKSAKQKREIQSVTPANAPLSAQNALPVSASDLWVVARTITPVVWDIVRPVLINWGIDKAKSLLIGLFTKKKVAATAK